MKSNEMTTLLVHFHLGALVQVELVAYERLVLGRKSRPGLVGTSIVVLHFGALDVVVKANDSLVAQFLYGGSIAELAHKHLLCLLFLLVDLLLGLRVEYVALLELERRRSQTQLAIKLDLDLFALHFALLAARHRYDVLLHELLQLRAFAQKPRQAVVPLHFRREMT